MRSAERLGITEAFVAVRRAAAVKADELRFVHKRHDFLDGPFFHEFADMATVIAFADNIFSHGVLLFAIISITLFEIR